MRLLLGHALAHLHWTPETFWQATNHELQAANEAVARANEAARRQADEARRSK